jgi:hypothetical protein
MRSYQTNGWLLQWRTLTAKPLFLKIAKVEMHLANLLKQKEDAEAELRSLREALVISENQNNTRPNLSSAPPDNISQSYRQQKKWPSLTVSFDAETMCIPSYGRIPKQAG